MKRLLALTLALALMLTFIPAASAADAPGFVKVNGERATFAVQPFIENGSTFVPIRFISEQLGFEVDWTEETQTVSIDDGRIVFAIGADTANVGGVTVDMSPTSRKLNGNTTFVPLRFISENLDCTVDWFAENNAIIINRKNTDGTELDAFTRCEQSELFEYKTSPDKLYPINGADYYIMRNVYTSNAGITSRESFIRSGNPTYAARLAVHELLKTFYPTGYEEVYDLLKKTALGEVIGTVSQYSPAFAGTCSDYYYDGREVHMMRSTDNGKVTLSVQIKDVGYVNPAPRLMNELSAESIAISAARQDIRDKSWWTTYEFDRW